MAKFSVGQRVKVVKEKYLSNDDSAIGKVGTITRPYGSDAWFVEFDDYGVVNCWYEEDEIVAANVRIIEGVVGDDLAYLTVGGEHIGLPFRDVVKRKVRVTIEVLD